MARAKYKRLVDLYVTGTEYVLSDGTPLWLQVLNPFERETVRKEAQIARARVVLAMKEAGSDEQARVKASFYAEGRDPAVQVLADAETSTALPKIIEAIRSDEDWSERLDILDRGDDDLTTTTAEDDLLLKLQADYLEEITKRSDAERDFQVKRFEAMDDDDLWAAYLDMWLERLGDETALLSFQAGQILYGARSCEGVRDADDHWDHSACAGHQERIWDTYTEVRSLPMDLYAGLRDAYEVMEFTDRQAKNSDRQMSSSGSSQLPSEVEASTASSPTETPVEPHGTSSLPSVTPSPSSDGSNYPTATSHPSASG